MKDLVPSLFALAQDREASVADYRVKALTARFGCLFLFGIVLLTKILWLDFSVSCQKLILMAILRTR